MYLRLRYLDSIMLQMASIRYLILDSDNYFNFFYFVHLQSMAVPDTYLETFLFLLLILYFPNKLWLC